MTSFLDWLGCQRHWRDSVGDLAWEVTDGPTGFPQSGKRFSDWQEHMKLHCATDARQNRGLLVANAAMAGSTYGVKGLWRTPLPVSAICVCDLAGLVPQFRCRRKQWHTRQPAPPCGRRRIL